MTQEQKQLLLKDLCSRLLYQPNLQIYYEEMSGSGVFDEELYEIDIDGQYCNDGRRLEDIKPYLRPISSMTEEERLYFHRNSARVQILVDEEKVITKPFYGYTTHLFDWLNSHHFDYRGLIEKGLALEAPKGMYNK